VWLEIEDAGEREVPGSSRPGGGKEVRGWRDDAGGRRGVKTMPGIPAKCLECGGDLRYDPMNLTYSCSVCQPVTTPATEETREYRKEAA
jgi:hypothetical protein